MIQVNPLIFRAYDIRGIGSTQNTDKADLTPETIRLIGQATGTYMQRLHGAKNMLVGRDNRIHGEALQKAFIEGILSTGMDVIDAGLATSPLIYYGTCKFNFDSGVNITASHNPKEYNGIKIVGHNAHSVCGDELQEIYKLIEKNDFETGNGSYSVKENIFSTFLEDIRARIHLPKKLKVVIDAGNGTAGKFAPDVMRAIGCDVTELYCNLDGTFPNHEANPQEEENMRDLMQKVIELKADLGIGFDGDGDRVGIVDEKGKHYSADHVLIMLVRDLLEHHPGAQIVFDVKASTVLINEIKHLGGIPVMSKTGHSFIEAKMHEIGAPLAGEISGHFFFGKTHYNYFGFDDALFGACKLLEVLASSGKPFSEAFTGLPRMYTSPEYKAYCPDDRKFQRIEAVKKHFMALYDCVTIDGVRINFDANSWGAVRCSNTTPNLTLRFESASPEKLAEIKSIMIEELRKYPEIDLSWAN